MKDAELAGQVGWWLHLTTNYIRHEKLGDEDFDSLAEKLFLREAELRLSPTDLGLALARILWERTRQAC